MALLPGQQGSAEVEASLQAHVREALAPFKAPRRVTFVEALPRSDRGKVLKGALRGAS